MYDTTQYKHRHHPKFRMAHLQKEADHRVCRAALHKICPRLQGHRKRNYVGKRKKRTNKQQQNTSERVILANKSHYSTYALPSWRHAREPRKSIDYRFFLHLFFWCMISYNKRPQSQKGEKVKKKKKTYLRGYIPYLQNDHCRCRVSTKITPHSKHKNEGHISNTCIGSRGSNPPFRHQTSTALFGPDAKAQEHEQPKFDETRRASTD